MPTWTNSTAADGDNAVMPEVRRRRSAVITGFILAAIVVGVGIAITPSEWGHGVIPLITPLVVTGAVAATLLVLGVYPHLILADDKLLVRNSLVRYEVPYARIAELRFTRLGMIIRSDAGKVIPATAYTGGSGIRLKANTVIGNYMMREIDHKVDAAKESKAKDVPPITRSIIPLNTYGVFGLWALAALCVWLSAVTYH
jgi:hypothetical protein